MQADDDYKALGAEAARTENACPPLVALLRRTAGGALDLNELREARTAFLAGIDENHAALNKMLSALSPHAMQQCATARNRLQKAFNTLRLAVNGRPNADSVMGAIDRANQAARWLQSRALLALGPTALGNVNLIARVLEDMATGKTPTASLDLLLADELGNIRSALSQSLPGPVTVALRGLRDALEPLVFREANPEPDALNACRERVLSAASALERSAIRDDKSRIEALLTNLRIYGDAGPAAEVVGLLQQDIASLHASMQGAIGPLAPTEVTATLRQLECCDALLLQLQAGEDVAAALIEGLDGLLEMQKNIEVQAERAGRTTCVRCGTENPPQRRTCDKCGAVLPVHVEEARGPAFEALDDGATNDFQMTENIHRMMSAIDAYVLDSATADVILSEILWMEELLARARDVDDEPSAHREVIQWYRAGLNEMSSGLECLKQALYDASPALLEQGRQAILAGAASVQRAQQFLDQQTI